MWTLKDLASAPPETRHNVLRRVGQMVFFDTLIALLLLLPAGSVRWLYGWIYIGLMVAIQLVGACFIPLDVLAERGSKKENSEKWDKLITRLLLASFLGIYLVAGLDFRGHWSGELALAWHIFGGILFLLGCGLEMWAMAANRFFSSAVRIQSERGHEVCSSGPYQFVRHPGYAGMILYFGISPLFLGSLWALIPAMVTAALFVIRSRLEDRTLQSKLPGYKEYAERVRYRLLPGVW